MSMITDMFGGGGDDASDAIKDATAQDVKWKQEALEYLKETEELPRAYREGALSQQGAEYGLTLGADGNIVSDGSTIAERALASPFYTGALQAGTDQIARNRLATGGLRSGNTQDALARYGGDLYQQSYSNQLHGLQGLAGLPSLAPAIAGGMSGIGSTYAQGGIGAAQAQQQGSQQGMGNLMGLGQLGLNAFGIFA